MSVLGMMVYVVLGVTLGGHYIRDHMGEYFTHFYHPKIVIPALTGWAVAWPAMIIAMVIVECTRPNVMRD
jgi:hypothetical protein